MRPSIWDDLVRDAQHQPVAAGPGRDVLEFRRVLKPGGRFVNLETSQPRWGIVRTLFHAYVVVLVRRVGSRISGSTAGYAYLSTTIPKFYGAEELAAILKEAGFAPVSVKRLLCGAAAVHTARKIF